MFDLLDRQVLWQLLQELGHPRKVVRIIETLYTNTESRVIIDGNISCSFQVRQWVQQGSMLAQDTFDVAMDPERSTSIIMHGTSVRVENFSYLDEADGVSLLTVLVELLLSALDIFAAKAATIRLVMN